MGSRYKFEAVLVDVDGTLTNTSGKISKRTSNAISSLKRKGISVGVCTSRNYAALVNYVLKVFSKDSLHVVSGGGQLVTARGKVIWEKRIDHEHIYSMCKKVNSLGGSFVFGRGKFLLCDSRLKKGLSKHPWGIGVKAADTLDDWSAPLVSIVNLNKEVENYISGLEKLNVIKVERTHRPDYFDITAEGVNKGTGLRLWSKIQKIDREKIVAIGDSINDLELLKEASWAVAMGQSPRDIKDVADEVVDHTDKDGLAIYLEKKFGL